MPEFEELRLKVILDDQASAQLAQIKTQLSQMGGGESQQGFERVRSNTSALTPIMRSMATGTLSARNAMGILGGAMGGVGIAVAGLGFAFVNQAQRLKAFTDQIVNIDTKARVLGIDGGALDNVVKQMRRMGVEDNKAIAFVEGVTKGIAELTTQGSKLNQFISTNIKTPENRERMDQFVANMIGFADKNDLEGMIAEFVASADYLFESEIAAGRTKLQASEKRNEYLKAFGLDPETAMLVPRTLQAATDAQKLQYRGTLQAARDYNTEYNKLSEQFKGFNTAMKEAMLPAFTEINKMFAEGGIDAEAWGRMLGTTIARDLKDLAAIVSAIQRVIEFSDRLASKSWTEWATDPRLRTGTEEHIDFTPPDASIFASGPGRAPTAEEAASATQLREEGGLAGRIGSKIGSWFGKRQGGGAVAGGQPYMVGEGGPELFVPQGGGTIMPGFGGAGGGFGLLREQIDEMRDNTEMVNQTTTLMRDLAEEFKQLNDFLQPQGEGGAGQPEPRQYGGSAYRGRKYLVGERGPEMFIPNRQGGGPVSAGQPYVVGEQGPELMVPEQSGVIQSTGAYSKYRKDVQEAIANAATETGLSRETLATMVEIESGGDPRRVNKTKSGQLSQYRGLLQINETTFKKYGGKGNILDPAQNVLAGGRRLAEYKTDLRKELGREPEDWEIYMRHQQGVGGFRAHYRGAEMGRSAWESFYSTKEGREHRRGPEYSKEAIWGNLPPKEKEKWGSVENVTSEGFLDFWKNRYASRYARATGQEYVPTSAGGGGEFGGAGASATFDAAELDRGEVDKMMGGEISTVKGTGTIDVNVGGSAAGRKPGYGRQLLKDVRIERVTQMQPAEAGPSGTDTTAESA